MNLGILIVGLMLIFVTNINGLIENTTIYKCRLSSCCRNAQKPSNYSHVKIKYTVNFTSESAYLTVIPINQENNSNTIYRFENITSGEPANKTLKIQNNFLYCFYQVKNSSQVLNKKMTLTYSFRHEFDEESFEAEKQIQKQWEEKIKIEKEIEFKKHHQNETKQLNDTLKINEEKKIKENTKKEEIKYNINQEKNNNEEDKKKENIKSKIIEKINNTIIEEKIIINNNSIEIKEEKVENNEMKNVKKQDNFWYNLLDTWGKAWKLRKM